MSDGLDSYLYLDLDYPSPKQSYEAALDSDYFMPLQNTPVTQHNTNTHTNANNMGLFDTAQITPPPDFQIQPDALLDGFLDNNYTLSFVDGSVPAFSNNHNNSHQNDAAQSVSSSSSPVLPETPQDEMPNPYQPKPQSQAQEAVMFNLNVFPNSDVYGQHRGQPEAPLAALPADEEKTKQPRKSSTSSSSQRPPRKQSESRISLPELYQRMGLHHDHEEARTREQRVLGILKDQGFQLGERTWIRDTTEQERRQIVDEIHRQTWDDYHYSKELIEVVIRRGSYYLMQGRLRRLRRASASRQKKLLKQQQQAEAMQQRGQGQSQAHEYGAIAV